MEATENTDPSVPPWEDDALPPHSHQSRAGIIIVVGIVTAILALVFTALRVHVRAILMRKWRIDDTVLVFAAVAAITHNSVNCIATKFGLGKHVWVVPTPLLIEGQKLSVAVVMVYQIAFVAVKIAFLLQYRRVFPLPKVELCCNIGIAFLVLFGISLLIAQGITYSIVYRNNFWNSPINILGWWLANASIHLVTDILIFLLPLPLLGRLRLRTTQKLALLASFGLGFLTCAISIIRIATLPNSLNSFDATYESTWTAVWSMAELSSAVICCCIPTLRPLLHPSRYSPASSRITHTNELCASSQRSQPEPPPRGGSNLHNDRVSSSMSCESDVVIRKPASSFFWQRSRQQSENSTLGGGGGGGGCNDDYNIEAVLPPPNVTTMTTVITLATPNEVTMPVFEVNGLRRGSEATSESSIAPRRTRSLRSSIRSEGSLAGLGGNLKRDFRRRMSLALTERDSDDDAYYFGVGEDVDMECPTPLSPPPKGRPSMTESR
ncbi:hypothetical protein CTRI78_v009988 [Colletotrichum trifolii]|uniref:Rhodopsin domain-containing protein n=1 Tax=Colletotrichum trifolii TaxID=5466 RepID=A0A4R8QPA5_COLTR|nr:hypothetical protein CTRI78_v009988 [Colletotrichum trifolii]